MELWDLYDKDRKLTGETHVRGVPIQNGNYHIVTDVWVIGSDGRLLITQRSPLKTFGLMWECTGGSACMGESSAQSAVRELYEEIGVACEESELELMHSIRLEDRFVDTYVLRRDVEAAELALQAEEVVAARLVKFDELVCMWQRGIVMPRERFGIYRGMLKKEIERCRV